MRGHVLAQGDGVAQLAILLSWAAWIACAACIAGILIVAGKMALYHQRGHASDHVSELGWVLVGCIIIGSAFALVGYFAAPP
jgi:formate hydrogenlyase subunit 3/multisubunit Na+/H+ antiporter MnhD subunit